MLSDSNFIHHQHRHDSQLFISADDDDVALQIWQRTFAKKTTTKIGKSSLVTLVFFLTLAYEKYLKYTVGFKKYLCR